ncbi:MAG: DUF3343 domain-containing protein [Bacteroidales bacterium]|nr:DUF3343 domain-containing protein [Bacteroidales bacterium]
MDGFCIYIFESVHKVMKAESLLLKADITFDIIHTPKEFSSDCGISIRINLSHTEPSIIERILNNNNIAFKKYKKEE